MEGPVVLGLANPKQPHWGHVDYRFGVSGGNKSSEDTAGYNGHKCCIWHTDGYYATVGSS